MTLALSAKWKLPTQEIMKGIDNNKIIYEWKMLNAKVWNVL